VYKKAKLKHHSILSNEIIEAAEDFDPGFDTEEELDIHSRVENTQQAEAKTKAALHKKNSVECDGSVSLPGNTLLIAGNNFELTGMGTLSGINHILTSTHTIDKGGGYIVTADVKRIKTIAPAKHKPKVIKQRSNGIKNITESAPSYDYSWGNSYSQPVPVVTPSAS
jgi:phage protein D